VRVACKVLTEAWMCERGVLDRRLFELLGVSVRQFA
jgi:hypothetical protein